MHICGKVANDTQHNTEQRQGPNRLLDYQRVLWDLRSEPWMRPLVFASSVLSFLFLYPSTFNLLEVAAVDEPKLHRWETGM
eukprot:gene16189-11581_t